MGVLTDWLSALSIPKVGPLAIDEWSYNALLSIVFSLRSLPLVRPLLSLSLPASPNVSLSSFHPPQPPPLLCVSLRVLNSFARPSIHSSRPSLSLALLGRVCCRYRSSMQGEIDAQDNGHRARGEPGKKKTPVLTRLGKDKMTAGEK